MTGVRFPVSEACYDQPIQSVLMRRPEWVRYPLERISALISPYSTEIIDCMKPAITQHGPNSKSSTNTGLLLDYMADNAKSDCCRLELRHSIVVSISPCHGDDRGSIPRVGILFSGTAIPQVLLSLPCCPRSDLGFLLPLQYWNNRAYDGNTNQLKKITGDEVDQKVHRRCRRISRFAI